MDREREQLKNKIYDSQYPWVENFMVALSKVDGIWLTLSS